MLAGFVVRMLVSVFVQMIADANVQMVGVNVQILVCGSVQILLCGYGSDVWAWEGYRFCVGACFCVWDARPVFGHRCPMIELLSHEIIGNQVLT